MRRSGIEDQLAGTLVGLTILGMILTAWFLIKCFELVVRVLVRHPHCKPVWTALAVFLLCLLGAIAFGSRDPFWNSLAAVSFAVLMAVTKIADLYFDVLLQNEMSKELVIDQALHQPWWTPDGQLAVVR
jgi:hypothetical protein